MLDDVLVRRVSAPTRAGRRAVLLAVGEADDEALTKIPLGEIISVRITRCSNDSAERRSRKVAPDFEALLHLDDDATGMSESIDLQAYRDGSDRFGVEIVEPWAGDSETGIGQTARIVLSREQTATLRDWLSFHLNDQ